MNRDCQPSVPKPRKRREVSNHIDTDRASNSLSRSPDATNVERPTPNSRRSELPIDALLTRPAPTLVDSVPFQLHFAASIGFEPAFEMLQGIDYYLVHYSFAIFRQRARCFPFVHLPAGAEPREMVSRFPFWTLAMCIVTCSKNSEIQQRLSGVFQRLLAQTLLPGKQQVLDVMKGLLIYLFWNHVYLPRIWIRQHLHLLAGMAADLGLCQTPSANRNSNGPPDAEKQKLCLGCYYLSSSIAGIGAHRGPNPIQWSPVIQRYATELSQNPTLPTDALLFPTIELCHLQEDLDAAITASESCVSPRNLYLALRPHTSSALSRLQSLRRQYPTEPSLFITKRMLVYARLQSCASDPHFTDLSDAAVAAKDYFDDILAKPGAHLHQATMSQWTDLLAAIVLLVRIARHQTPKSSAMAWEVGALQSLLQPEELLTALVNHVRTATQDPLMPRHEGLVEWFVDFAATVRAKLAKERAGIASGSEESEGRFKPVNQDQQRTLNGHGHAGAAVEQEDKMKFDLCGFGLELLEDEFWREFLGPG